MVTNHDDNENKSEKVVVVGRELVTLNSKNLCEKIQRTVQNLYRIMRYRKVMHWTTNIFWDWRGRLLCTCVWCIHYILGTAKICRAVYLIIVLFKHYIVCPGLSRQCHSKPLSVSETLVQLQIVCTFSSLSLREKQKQRGNHNKILESQVD